MLVLAGKIVFANCAADVIESGERLAPGMQGLALAVGEMPGTPEGLDRMHLVFFGDCRERHDLPWLLATHMADQVVFVQALHDDDDGAAPLVVEPAVEGMAEPVVGGLPLRVGERLLGFQRIIDQDDVGAASGQHPAAGGGEPIALAGGHELLHRLAMGGKLGRKDPPVPLARHDATAVARELVGEILGVADAEELRRRVAAQAPRWERDRGQQGFQMARRQVDDQPPDLALPHRSELGGDDFDVPVHRECCLWVQIVKAAHGEGGKVLAQ